MASVLLLEPCGRTRRSITRVLAGADIACLPMTGVAEALKHVAEFGADLLIMDVDLFRQETGQCLEVLRARGLDVPALLLSGGHPHDPDDCSTRCGWADSLLIKPFENSCLLAAVMRLLAAGSLSVPSAKCAPRPPC